MKEEYQKELEKEAIELLKKDNENKSLSVLSKRNCSEISRILGLRIMRDVRDSKPFILKGNVTVTGLKEENDHDILAFYDERIRKYILLDPTIWQFFPDRGSIQLGEFKSLEEAISFAVTFYRGRWKISEYIDGSMEKEVSEWKRIIKLNCDQTPEWK